MLLRPRFILPLLALLVVLSAGCGGDEQSGNPQEDRQQGQQQESKKEARETKIAIGEVVAVHPDRRRMVVRPSREVEGAEKVPLKVRKNAEIMLGGEKAEMGDMAEGQQAKAEYVLKNNLGRAVSVQLFEAGGSSDEQREGTSN